MKKINIGDKVRVISKYRKIEEECIFLGYPEENSPEYIAVAFKRDGIAKVEWLQSIEDVELVATVSYTPIPRFHKGDKAFWRQQEVMIVEEREEDLCYVCYNQAKKILVVYPEKDLLTEKELEKTLEKDLPKAKFEEEEEEGEI